MSNLHNSLIFPQQQLTTSNHQLLTLIVASTSDELEQVNNLWHEVYVDELGWLPPQEESLLHDSYHPHSVYLLARVDNKAVATMRLVFDSVAGLPLEQSFRLGPIKKSTPRAIEAQRLMVSPVFRQLRKIKGAPFGLCLTMIKAGFHYCFIHQVSHIFVDAFVDTKTTPLKIFKVIGFEEIGCPFIDTKLLCSQSKSIAMVIDPVQLLSQGYRNRSYLFKYLFEFDTSFKFY
ncbi:MAG: GNAT family N-acetyltransferase [Okeania sp. SIO2G4]|uniref:N-acyl amino acid synthase FeeM domain-containing protein n=1 Tax=unclassified Okeania TaxID=2634635 RepID=UPI0013B86317|nr:MULTISPECIES: GNAT family N-acyltransferase [unclassified Okeania]NEP06372.1 GNAT family N-acetyltransferase [Okeania sp. SIO4D6]NEP71715.1 GNAT family N-acetyltransferase [Okeania sp. SIO2G5]NEP96647.1 GNAT family N-acetyltransferase [Okeania sp. SIO2F5]NEQ90415.1 GNAT family N-acetyltransferase [Okeania sp. SIO2G4]